MTIGVLPLHSCLMRMHIVSLPAMTNGVSRVVQGAEGACTNAWIYFTYRILMWIAVMRM